MHEKLERITEEEYKHLDTKKIVTIGDFFRSYKRGQCRVCDRIYPKIARIAGHQYWPLERER